MYLFSVLVHSGAVKGRSPQVCNFAQYRYAGMSGVLGLSSSVVDAFAVCWHVKGVGVECKYI